MSTFLPRMRAIMNRALAKVSMEVHVAMANTWRDNYNPLRGLTIMKAVLLLEDGERGAYGHLGWTYRFIEMQDATLGALVERRTSAIQELDWNIKTREEIPAGKEAIAKRQAQALKAAYDKVTNLSAALEFLALASFRGFSHLEMIDGDHGDVTEFRTVDQWFWCRQGIYGQWLYNKTATFGSVRGEEVDLSRFIIREVARPINRVALIAFIRKNLSQKDWDAFIETYGIPAVFLIMPPSVPAGQEAEYLEMAEQVASDARGTLPNGSDVKTVDNGARGNNPFKDHIAYQDEQIVLRGTGGLLTMLTQSGSGTLAGSAHAEVFKQIAKAEAKEISETLRQCFDARIIEQVTPGEPALAYFELAANEETSTSAVVKDVSALSRSGFQVSPEWIEEKTGYKVTLAPVRGQTALAAEPQFNRKSETGDEWKLFAKETGTLGIPRSVMPQIQSGNRASMVNKLRAKGISYTTTEIKPSDLKPTQAEYCPAKVEKAHGYEGTPRAILVSSDNHIIDGHHQYMDALQTAPNKPIPVFKINATALVVIGHLLEMPSTGQEPLRNNEQPDKTFKDFIRDVRPGEEWPSDDAARESIAKDMQPLCDALFAASQANDEAAFRAGLKKISARLPEFVQMPDFEKWLSGNLTGAWLGNTKTDQP